MPTSLRKPIPWICLALFAIGFCVRMVDLTDAPFDFHPTRQLLDAIMARDIYQQMLPAADGQTTVSIGEWMQTQEIYEPPVLPYLVALSYRAAGGEYLWIARIWTSLFWLLGGLALYLLGKRFFSTPVALFALAFYLFQPFGISASRSFQPDPLMVALILWAAWALVRWADRPTWKNAVMAGVLCGLALFVKVTAAFALIGIALALVLTTYGWKRFWRQPQVWAIAGLAAALPVAYYLIGLGARSGGYFSFWSLSFGKLFLEPSFYGDWLQLVDGILGLVVLFLALAGVWLANPPARRFLLGFWGGYVVYMLSFPYQITTHEYYHLQLVPLAALSLASIAELIFERAGKSRGLARLAFAMVVVLAAAYPLWSTVRVMQYYDYRPEAEGWERMGQALPKDGSVIGLVHDYGFPLAYYGHVSVGIWPAQYDLKMDTLRGAQTGDAFANTFEQRTAGYRYFLVTLMGELDKQPELKNWLEEHYPCQTGDGYLLYDLSGSK